MIINIVSFTENGDNINLKIVNGLKKLGNEVFGYGNFDGLIKRDDNIFKWSEKKFYDSDALIFIGAVGIAVRAISGLLRGKDKDPAVIVCDEKGRYVIPILSGHIGGGNKTAETVSEILSAQAIITTATDINNVWAVDSWAIENNYYIENIKEIKNISSALLKGENVGIKSYFKLEGNMPDNIISSEKTKNGIVISPYLEKVYENNLNIVLKCVCVGVGSRKNADKNALIELFKDVCKKENISENAVYKIATIDIKKDEKSVLMLSEYLKKDIILYSSKELNEVMGEFSSSEFVKDITGTDNVCERACVKISGGDLIVRKTKGNGVTLAMAVIKESVKF